MSGTERDCPDGQNGEWHPTRGFYASNPRSEQVRRVCVQVLQTFDALLHDPKAAFSERMRASLYRRLSGLDTRLTELGISVEMYQDVDITGLENEPVLMAEIVAGVISQEIGRPVTPAEEVQPLIEEFSTGNDGLVYCLDLNQSLPRKLREFLEVEYLVAWGYQAFAVSEAERNTLLKRLASRRVLHRSRG